MAKTTFVLLVFLSSSTLLTRFVNLVSTHFKCSNQFHILAVTYFQWHRNNTTSKYPSPVMYTPTCINKTTKRWLVRPKSIEQQLLYKTYFRSGKNICLWQLRFESEIGQFFFLEKTKKWKKINIQKLKSFWKLTQK